MHPAARSSLCLVVLGLAAGACRDASPSPPAAAPAPGSSAGPATGPATPGPGARAAALAARGSAAARRPASSFRVPPVPAPADRSAAEVPYRLTASDGTGLRLVAITARGVVQDPLAFTELHLTFENPEARVIEGQFRVTLPEGASLSRFAMLVDDRWQEGEVVELAAARVAYEDFLHRRQDPALLEQAAGNEFQARVFPIPARAQKHLVVSYSQELAALDEPYRIPLLGLPEVESVDVRVLLHDGAASPRAVAERRPRAVPDRDFEIAAADLPRQAGLRVGNLIVARVTPVAEAEPDEIPSLAVLVDTSASRALGFADQVELVRGLIAALRDGAGPDVPVLVAAFDQDVELVYEGTAAGFGASQVQRLLARRPLGASDPGLAMRWLAARGENAGGHARVVLITDGVATAGGTEGAALGEAARGLAAVGAERLDAIVVGGIRDEALLRQLTTAGLPRAGAVIDARRGLVAVADRLTRATRSDISVAIEGAAWVWPQTLDGVQAGDDVLVYADLPEGRPLRLTVGGAPLAEDGALLGTAARPLLDRALARARVARLLHDRDALPADDDAGRKALQAQIVEVSVGHRVVSPFTALLVLETEADYARFRIDRRALADILTCDDAGIAIVDRTRSAPLPPAPPPDRTKGEEGKMGRADRARSAGVLGVLRADEDGGSFASLTGTGDVSSGLDDRDVHGGLLGNEVGEMQGGWGYGVGSGAGGMRGRTAGGGGTGAGTIGLGSSGRIAGGARAWERSDREDEDEDGTPRARGQYAMRRVADEPDRPQVAPYTGRMKEVMDLLASRRPSDALARARAWREADPGDVLALVALGEALEAAGDRAGAARAYGSMIDLFPARADLRRFAGARLERVDAPSARALALDTFAKAVAQRPDHPSSHRLHAFALLRAGRPEAAFAALEAGLGRDYPEGRFRGAKEILAEDLGLAAAAWIRTEPARAAEIRTRLAKAGGVAETAPSLRFVLTWETDANDVDFHIRDGRGDHAFYSQPTLASGGRLYADVTTGYGPECFTIRGGAAGRAYPYTLSAHYYARGPMGYGMGKLEIVEHDGKGGLRFEERPFVIMQDNAFVALGTVAGGGGRRAPGR